LTPKTRSLRFGLVRPGPAINVGEHLAAITLMERREWERMTGARLIGFGLGVALLLLLIFRCEPGFVVLLDHANLLFHEAGHPLVGLFSSRLEPYGGTIGQLVFPCVLAVSFWRKGQTLGFATACIWFFENWFNIARYMADARKLELPLVGGGDHDWNTILTRWDLLQYDTRIAAALKLGAWTGIAAVCAWVLWRAWQDRERPAAQPDCLAS
jgi:hypothetical protein